MWLAPQRQPHWERQGRGRRQQRRGGGPGRYRVCRRRESMPSAQQALITGGRTREVSIDLGAGGRLRRRTGRRTSDRTVRITNTARECRRQRPLAARTEQAAEE